MRQADHTISSSPLFGGFVDMFLCSEQVHPPSLQVKGLHVSNWAEVARNPINHNMATSRPYTRCPVLLDGVIQWNNHPFIALTPEV